MSFPHLLNPIALGPRTAPNRVYMSPHQTGFATREGYVDDRYVEYVEERARHGVGTISTGMFLVMPNALSSMGAQIAYDDGCVPGMTRLAAAIRRHGAIALAQLNHTGRQTDSSIGRAALFAPSALPFPQTREVPKEMEAEDIDAVVAAFARAARYVRAAGFDGIEIHASRGYLIEQFLSPYTNKRTDEYGGSLENRRRFLSEVVDAVRAAWEGEPMVLGAKLTVQQPVPGGLSLEEGCVIARWLEQEKGLDFIHVSEGPAEVLGATGNGMHTPLGPTVDETATVKSCLSRALAIANRRIKRPGQADEILAEGKADMVSLARGLIADPAFVAKAAAGMPERVRTCIACDQDCFGRSERQRPISCLQNPAVGLEGQWAEHRLESASRPLRLVVVGGGPAGMKTAEVAARRGHHVALYEADDELGGQVRLAAVAPYREEMGEITSHLIGELWFHGVEVQLGRRLSLEDILALDADAVVVATGSEPVPPPLRGDDGQIRVHSVREALAGADLGQRVVVVDLDGHWPALTTAEYLAGRGHRVTFVTPIPMVGIDVSQKGDLYSAMRRMYSLGVGFHAGHSVGRAEGNDVILVHQLSGREQLISEVDAIVYSGSSRADDSLYRALKSMGRRVYAVGDCVAPRRATDAIFDGHRLGASI